MAMAMTSAYSHSNPRVVKLTAEQKREAVQLYEEGDLTYSQIGARYGVSASAIVYHVTRRTVLRRDRPGKGRAASGRRLTAEERVNVRQRLAAGEAQRSIADSLGVSHAAIRYYANRPA